ncbi:MAG: NfeD family protein [Defluviitaleaceae bacterium]|nr:NfeD family protein [Defluviitaleaceae bacterium]
MYLAFFIIGVGFVIISFVFSSLIDIDGSSGPLIFLQPKLIAVFLIVTGAAGMILSGRDDNVFSQALILLFSVGGGILASGLVYSLVILPLHRAQNTSTFSKQEAVGTAAKVISPILPNGYGKIRYNISGSVVTSPAKSEDGGEIKNGEDVAIVYIEGGTYFVKRMFETQDYE